MAKRKDPLMELPGVGPRMALALRKVGVESPCDLVGKNPKTLYEKILKAAPEFGDPCVLYVFRCAVWAAENPEAKDPDLRNWWAWKDVLSRTESER